MRESKLQPQWEMAPRLAERVRLAREVKNEMRKKGEADWDIRTGLYEDPVFEVMGEYQSPDGLTQPERLLKDQALRTLHKKREAGDLSPVVMLDFGGMWGLSFISIAQQLEKEGQYISRGDIVLVVSNLAFTPGQGIDQAISQKPSWWGSWLHPIFALFKEMPAEHIQRDLFYLDKYLDSIREALERRFVHYVVSDAAELKRQTITLPDGREISLNGAIDIIHERTTLGHGIQTDADMVSLERVLSRWGVLISGSLNLFIYTDRDTPEMHRDREHAFGAGKRNLMRSGMQYHIMPHPEAPTYEIFSKPDAPPIEKPKD